MSDFTNYHNYNLEEMPKEGKNKRLRNKNSYIDAFLERRKQAANFALRKPNSSGYNYSKPFYYITEGKFYSKNNKQNKCNQNSIEDKEQFYKSYNNLKNNLIGKNNSINNIVLIEKENNKYYLSQGLPRNYNYNHDNNSKTLNHHSCNYCKRNNYLVKSNQNEYDINDYENEERNKKYNNTKHHSINVSKKNKSEKNIESKNIPTKNHILSKNDKNKIDNNLKIERTRLTNYCDYDKKNNELSPELYNDKNKEHYIINNHYEYIINNDKNKYNQNTHTTPNSNINLKTIKSKIIQSNNKKNPDNDIYYKGSDNHKYYESNSNKISYYKYNSQTNLNNDDAKKKFYTRNYSEPQNLERNKKVYIIKGTQNSIDFDNYIKKQKEKNQINNISPIRTFVRYYYEDNNEDFQGIEKIYESQSLNGNSINNSNQNLKYAIKLQNNYSNNKNNLYSADNNEKGKRTKSADILNTHSTEIIRDTPNTKTVSIVYNSQSNNLGKNNVILKSQKKNNIEIIEKINDNNHKEFININNNKNNNSIKEDKDNDNKNIYEYKEINHVINNINIKNEKDNNNKNENILKNSNCHHIIINENNIKDERKEKKIENNPQLSNNKNNENNENDNNENNIEVYDLENNFIIHKINKGGRNKNNNNIINENNREYQRIVDQEQNYETIKDKYESFLRQKDEKEPNLQSKIMNSMLTSKEDINSNNNLVKNIKEKINILKNNNKIVKQNINYSNEIDDYFIKIKKKEEKNNLALNEYYQNLLKKEMDEKNDKNNNDNNSNINKGFEINNDNKKMIIKKSNRLQHMMNKIINNKKYRYYGIKNNKTIPNKTIFSKTFFPSNKKEEDFNELTLKNHFNNIKLSKYNNAPDINLIVDEDNIKLFDENEYSKLKMKNIKSARPINFMIQNIKESGPNLEIYRNRFDLFKCYNYGNNNCIVNNEKYKHYFSPRFIYHQDSNKIMPANEII